MPHVEGQGPPGVRREQGVRPQFQEHAGGAARRSGAPGPWFDGSCSGTLARAGVVRYGPWIRKPRNVSFSVEKNTVSGDRPHAAI